MKTSNSMNKDRSVRAMAGFLILVLLMLQKAFSIDLSLMILGVGINLFQFGITGWCPIAAYFAKIGWLQRT